MRTSRHILELAGAVITDSHFVYTSKKHGSGYVNKDAVYPNPEHVNFIAANIARWVLSQGLHVDVVIAPAIGAVKLEKAVVEEMRHVTRRQDIVGAYAEREEKAILTVTDDNRQNIADSLNLHPGLVPLGSELVLKLPNMVIKRGYDKLIPGKNVLVVEDILTTGQSAKRTVDAVRRHDGNVVAVAAICNRGAVTAERLGVDVLHSEVEVAMEMYEPDKCPLCAQGVPVNTQYGHGKAFLAEQKARE